MKVIFLDVDGVLNGYNKFVDFMLDLLKPLHLDYKFAKYYDIFGIHTRKVKRLAKIVHKTNAKVVMSSSWRFAYFNNESKNIHINKLKRLCVKYEIDIIDRTGISETRNREEEIREWLNCHNGVESFVILDDEQFDLQGFIGKELVRTSEKDYICGKAEEDTGLKRKHVKQAIKILNKEM